MKAYVISTYVLAGALGLVILVLIVVSVMLLKERSKNSVVKIIEKS